MSGGSIALNEASIFWNSALRFSGSVSLLDWSTCAVSSGAGRLVRQR